MRRVFAVAASMVVAPIAMADFTIVNSDFENPVYGPGGFGTTGTTGWTQFSPGSASWGSFHPTVGTWGYTAPEGNQVLYTNSVTVQQTLADVVLPGMTYTLEVDVVNRPTFGSLNYTIDLVFGDKIVASDHATLTPPVGGFMTSVITYTATAGDPLIGQPITIRLGGPGNQCNFDDVRLNGLPTPGALALLGLGGVFASRRRR